MMTASANLEIIREKMEMPSELIIKADKYSTIERWVR